MQGPAPSPPELGMLFRGVPGWSGADGGLVPMAAGGAVDLDPSQLLDAVLGK
jgi:hypothetical protein